MVTNLTFQVMFQGHAALIITRTWTVHEMHFSWTGVVVVTGFYLSWLPGVHLKVSAPPAQTCLLPLSHTQPWTHSSVWLVVALTSCSFQHLPYCLKTKLAAAVICVFEWILANNSGRRRHRHHCALFIYLSIYYFCPWTKQREKRQTEIHFCFLWKKSSMQNDKRIALQSGEWNHSWIISPSLRRFVFGKATRLSLPRTFWCTIISCTVRLRNTNFHLVG